MTRLARDALTLLVLAAGLTTIVHWLIVGLDLIDPTRIPQ